MKKLISTLILTLQISLSMSQSNIEQKLELQLPQDLKQVWVNQQWNENNNVFTLYNFKPFYLLSPKDEINIISLSKSLNGYLELAQTEIKKSIVIAKSFLNDEGQYLFYGFDVNGKNLGIWSWHLDKGPQFPSKISNNLTEIFESLELMSNGFNDSDIISKLWIKATQKKLDSTDFVYGNFPTKDLKIIAEQICSNIIYFPNKTTFLVDSTKLNEIDEFYSKFGRVGLRLEMNDKHLTEFLQKTNMEPFNIDNERKIFVIKFYNSPTYGLCNCTKFQAKELNRFGYLSFFNLEDSKDFSEFINK